MCIPRDEGCQRAPHPTPPSLMPLMPKCLHVCRSNTHRSKTPTFWLPKCFLRNLSERLGRGSQSLSEHARVPQSLSESVSLPDSVRVSQKNLSYPLRTISHNLYQSLSKSVRVYQSPPESARDSASLSLQTLSAPSPESLRTVPHMYSYFMVFSESRRICRSMSGSAKY